MKDRHLFYTIVLFLILSGNAIAGTTIQVPVDVPTFTPWGEILGAAVLGISGVYTIIRKKK
jgi:hypothetical protein